MDSKGGAGARSSSDLRLASSRLRLSVVARLPPDVGRRPARAIATAPRGERLDRTTGAARGAAIDDMVDDVIVVWRGSVWATPLIAPRYGT
jgi:hypothetical protein